MVLELADRLGPPHELPAPRAGRAAAARAAAAARPAPPPVVEALSAFGFNAKQAEDAVRRGHREGGAAAPADGGEPDLAPRCARPCATSGGTDGSRPPW